MSDIVGERWLTVGHLEAKVGLEGGLPQTVLLVGPAGTGKRTLLREAAARAGIRSYDIQEWDKLGVKEARGMISWTRVAPMGGVGKAAIIDLDASTEPSQNALLKGLEEPPRWMYWLLHSSRDPLITVVSRAQLVVRSGLLDEWELQEILIDRMGMSSEHAEMVRNAGSVVSAQRDTDKSRNSVVSALKAVAEGDLVLLMNVAQDATTETIEQLLVWATEVAAGVEPSIGRARSFGLQQDRNLAIQIRERLISTYAKPRLALLQVLAPITEKRSNA